MFPRIYPNLLCISTEFISTTLKGTRGQNKLVHLMCDKLFLFLKNYLWHEHIKTYITKRIVVVVYAVSHNILIFTKFNHFIYV